MTTNWQSPKQIMMQRGIKAVVGEILDPIEIGLPEHPIYGPLPRLTVTDAHADGRLLHGEIECECGAKREVGAGDWFQVRRCEQCQKLAQQAGRRVMVSPEKLAERAAKKAAKEEARELRRSEKKAESEVKKAENAAKRAEAAKAKLEAKAELLRKVAAEKGVKVSDKAIAA